VQIAHPLAIFFIIFEIDRLAYAMLCDGLSSNQSIRYYTVHKMINGVVYINADIISRMFQSHLSPCKFNTAFE
jgi:hypothetical protein